MSDRETLAGWWLLEALLLAWASLFSYACYDTARIIAIYPAMVCGTPMWWSYLFLTEQAPLGFIPILIAGLHWKRFPHPRLVRGAVLIAATIWFFTLAWYWYER
jgi:hypothetical protein